MASDDPEIVEYLTSDNRRFRERIRVQRSNSVGSALKQDNGNSIHLKKTVRFADSLGLDLEDVIPRSESPAPKLRLTGANFEVSVSSLSKYLQPRFILPHEDEIDSLILERKVCLETITVKDFAITGVVKVANISFDKQVTVRYTLDNWSSFVDVNAWYISGSTDAEADRFVFTIFLPFDLPVSSLCEMAVRYQASGQEFWDNNGERNFALECCTIKNMERKCDILC